MDLDIKYRPRVFEDFCGNESIIRLISRYLTEKTLPNVIIFNGASGCGKTTLAYLIAKKLLCQHDNGGVNPCGECDMCRAIEDSLYRNGTAESGLGIHTFDMSLYGDESDYIKNVCNVIDSPLKGNRKRIILLEELHITQTHLQEKLDRVLEFIKPNVYVFICTTNIKKIVVPIQRRATIINLTVPSKESQMSYLSKISMCEHSDQSKDMLRKILEISKNNPAKAVKNLSIIIKAPQEGLEVLFTEHEREYDTYIEFFDSISMGVIGIIEFIEDKVSNPSQFLIGLQDFIYSTFKLRYYTGAVATPRLRKKVRESMEKYSDKSLVNILNILNRVGYCTDNDAKRQLLLIGYETNPSLYEAASSPDSLNAVVFHGEKMSEESSISELKENHFGLSSFSKGYDKAMGLTTIDNL